MLNNKKEKKRSSSADKRTFAKAGHMCMVCGFRASTKNKYRELQDHLVRQHFQERIKAALPTRRPFVCPDAGCEVEGKDWQALMRHYTGKHGILESYLKEVIAQGLVNKAYRENMKKPRVSALNPVLDDYIMVGGPGGGGEAISNSGGSDKENSTSPPVVAAKRPTRVSAAARGKRKKRPSEASSNNDSSSSSSGGDICPMGMLPSDILLDEGNNNKILTGTVFNQDLPQVPPPLTVQLAAGSLQPSPPAPTTVYHHQQQHQHPHLPQHPHPHHHHPQVVPTSHHHHLHTGHHHHLAAGADPVMPHPPPSSSSDDDHVVEIDDSEMAENPTHLALVLKRSKLDPSSGMEMPPEESYAFVDLKYFTSISANKYVFKGYEEETTMMMDQGLMEAADSSSSNSYTTLPPMQHPGQPQPQQPQQCMQTVVPPSVDGYQHLYQPVETTYLDSTGYPQVVTDVATSTSPSFYSSQQTINIVSPVSQYNTNILNLPPDAIVTPCSGAPLLTLPPAPHPPTSTSGGECMPQYALDPACDTTQQQHQTSESRIDLGQIVRQTIQTNQGLGGFELQQQQQPTATYFPMEATAADGTAAATLVATAPMEAAEAALVMNTQEVVSTEEVVSAVMMQQPPSPPSSKVVVVENVTPIEAAACEAAVVGGSSCPVVVSTVTEVTNTGEESTVTAEEVVSSAASAEDQQTESQPKETRELSDEDEKAGPGEEEQVDKQTDQTQSLGGSNEPATASTNTASAVCESAAA